MHTYSSTPYTLEKGLLLRTSSKELIKAEQQTFLRQHLQHAYTIPHYRNCFNRLGITDMSQVDEDIFTSLPFTSRLDIDGAPQLFGVKNENDIRDIAVTSGTTGSPVIVPYTQRDLHRLAYNEALAFYSAGVRSSDRVLLTVTLDRCFIAGLAYYSGVTMVGATAIRSGPGQPSMQWQLLETLKPTVIVGVPSFLLKFGAWGMANNKDVGNSGVKRIITIGEPSRNPDYTLTGSGQQLEEMWGAKVFSSYGATEFETAFGECQATSGGHVHPELMIVEIIDDQGNILEAGQAGEIVVTPLGVEGFPLIRFRTGDIGRLDTSECSCGWNTSRLGPVEGRLAQRLKFKGTTFYPETIFNALQGFKRISGVYLEVRSSNDGIDDVTVVIGCDDQNVDLPEIEETLQAHLRVKPRIKIQSCLEVDKTMTGHGGRKPKKFFDFRS